VINVTEREKTGSGNSKIGSNVGTTMVITPLQTVVHSKAKDISSEEIEGLARRIDHFNNNINLRLEANGTKQTN
jgi:hypothetical protein